MKFIENDTERESALMIYLVVSNTESSKKKTKKKVDGKSIMKKQKNCERFCTTAKKVQTRNTPPCGFDWSTFRWSIPLL